MNTTTAAPAGPTAAATPNRGRPMSDEAIIARSLFARPVSTLTTAALVAIAVGLLIALLTLRSAWPNAFTRGAGNVQLVVSAEDNPLSSVLNSLFYANAPRRSMTWAKFQDLASLRPFEFAIPTQMGDSYLGSPVVATTPDYLAQFQPVRGEPWRLAQGRAFEQLFDITQPPDQRRVALEAVVGADVAARAQIDLSTGQPRRINLTHGSPRDPAAHVHKEYDFTVVGVLAPTGTLHDRCVFVPLEASWLMHAHDRRVAEPGFDGTLTDAADLREDDMLITGVYLALPSRGEGPPAGLPQLFTQLRADPTITVASPSDQIRSLQRVVGNVDYLLVAIALIVMLSSAVSIALALANAMGQRRRQIAILRVLGATRLRVFSLVLTESAVIGLLGAGLGVAIGALGLTAGTWWIEQQHGIRVDAALAPADALPTAVGAILLATLAGAIPALLAYRTPVVRHLRPLA